MIKGIDNFQINVYNDYNRIKSEQEVSSALGKQQENAEKAVAAPEAGKSLDLRLDDIRPRQNATLEDISLSLNEKNSFEMKGRESDIESLDMEKAVSDMQKDQALMQYQYFVGDTNLFNSEDGIVIQK